MCALAGPIGAWSGKVDAILGEEEQFVLSSPPWCGITHPFFRFLSTRANTPSKPLVTHVADRYRLTSILLGTGYIQPEIKDPIEVRPVGVIP